MKVFVTVKPSSKKDGVQRTDAAHFTIAVTSPPRDGKANSAAISLLARYLGVSKSRIEIIAGAKSKQKVFEVA